MPGYQVSFECPYPGFGTHRRSFRDKAEAEKWLKAYDITPNWEKTIRRQHEPVSPDAYRPGESGTADMRAWLRESHPELGVGERGRINPVARGIYEDEVLLAPEEGEEESPGRSSVVMWTDILMSTLAENTAPLTPEERSALGTLRALIDGKLLGS